VFRQADEEFVGILETIRRGSCTPAHLKYFEGCGSALGPTNLVKVRWFLLPAAFARMNTDSCRVI
jgi:hypothetical protein